MEPFLGEFVDSVSGSAAKFGTRMEPHIQTFRSCANLAYAFVQSPTDPAPLESQIGLLDDALEVVANDDILFHHITAISDAAYAFACVINDNPYSTLESISEELTPTITALSEMKDSSHRTFADNVNLFLQRLKAWVDANPKDPSSNSVSSLQEHTAPHLINYRTSISDAVAKDFSTASVALGGSLPIQALNLSEALEQVYVFIVAASQMPNPPSDEAKQQMALPIANLMTKAATISANSDPADHLNNHLKAIGEAMPMFSWVVATKAPFSFVTDAQSSSSFYLNKVLMTTKKQPDAPLHKAFVDSLKAIFSAVKTYIKEYHTQGIRYGIGIAASPSDADLTSPVSDHDDEQAKNNYVTAFAELISGPLQSFVKASKDLGGDVAMQSALYAEAWEMEEKFLKNAFVKPKPSQDHIQTLLSPLGGKMGAVAAVSESTSPQNAFSPHCSAVAESVQTLGWVAVNDKAAVYVGEMAGAGQFYVDKVKMAARKTDNPVSHRNWAKALENLHAQLKAYVKEHHTQMLVWNPPKVLKKSTPFSNGNVDSDEGDAEDYVASYRNIISNQLAKFVQVSKKLGGPVEKQATAFAEAWEAEAQFLSKAISMPKPEDIQALIAPIADKMGAVGAVSESLSPRDPYVLHCNAVAESVSALGWVVVEEKATAFVGDMAGAGQFFLDKMKMKAKTMEDPATHREWAQALEALYSDLKAYVKEHHTQALVWNPPKATKRPSAVRSNRDSDADVIGTDYVAAFKELLPNQLAAFSAASKKLGGAVEKQAIAFAGAWEAEAEFLLKALNMPKPEDIQGMVAPIVAKMGEVAGVTESLSPRDPFSQHCNAVSESVSALGWIAVESKATAFVGDMAGAGQFFLNKVKMEAKKKEDPSAHREWAKALETLYKDLKAYVKEYHTQQLVWNPPKTAQKAPTASKEQDGPKSSDYVAAFKNIISGSLSKYLTSCKELGGVVEKQAGLYADAWEEEAAFLKKAASMAKPGSVNEMLAPIANKMSAVAAIAEEIGTRAEFGNHCTAVAESMPALGWVAVDEKAAVYVSEMSGAGQFFLNKVKMGANKTTNPAAHRKWAKSLETVLSELHKYVKEYHTQKLTWKTC